MICPAGRLTYFDSPSGADFRMTVIWELPVAQCAMVLTHAPAHRRTSRTVEGLIERAPREVKRECR